MALELGDFALAPKMVVARICAIAKASRWPSLLDEISASCRSEEAFYFVDDNGFVVLKPIVSNGVSGVLIWTAFHACRGREYLLDIDQLALEIGASFLEFWSYRRGFERVAPALGYHLADTVLRNGVTLAIWRKSL